jgi:hypothetical protein
MTYEKFAAQVPEPGRYRVHYYSQPSEEYQLYPFNDDFVTIPCVGDGSGNIHTPFPFFKLLEVTKVERVK